MSDSLTNAWSRVDVKNGIKSGIAAVMSFYLGLELNQWIERPDPLISGLWSVVAAMVVLQANLGATYQAIITRFFGVLIGSTLGALVSWVFGAHILLLGVTIFLTMIVCSLLNLKESYRIACLSVAVVMIPWGLHQEISPWTFAFFRFLDTLVGILVAVAVAHGIWPSRSLEKLQSNIIHLLNLQRQLFQYLMVFITHLERRDKVVNQTVDEIQQLFIQSKKILDESKVEIIVFSTPLIIWKDIFDTLERIYESLHALIPVVDKGVENMFDEEFKKQIDDTVEMMDKTFKELAEKIEKEKDYKLDLNKLLNAEEGLNQQMTRFREQRAMRKYSLEEVERYFVYCFSLKTIIHEQHHLNTLLDSSEPDFSD